MLLAQRSRRTRRLARAQMQVGVALGGETGSRLAHRLGMPTGGDTLLRLIRATPVATTAAPTIIGVDDWALKKRTRYGTIIVDLKHRRPIDPYDLCRMANGLACDLDSGHIKMSLVSHCTAASSGLACEKGDAIT